MPFPDELRPVDVVVYRDIWPQEFSTLAERLLAVVRTNIVAIDHVGSTAVPGLAAKDVIDVQIRVSTLHQDTIIDGMASAGFRLRPEAWNQHEVTNGIQSEKLVFAAPEGERLANVHVRLDGSVASRFALLVVDYLRAHPAARDAWGDFKTRLARSVPDHSAYGQIKQPAWSALMVGANAWAKLVAWSPGPGNQC